MIMLINRLSSSILLIATFSFYSSAQSGDLTRNPFKEDKKFIQNAIDHGAFYDGDSVLIMTGYGAVVPPEPTEFAIPVGSSVGSGGNDGGNADGSVQLGFQISKLGSFHAKIGFSLSERQELVQGSSVNNYLLNPGISSLGANAGLTWWMIRLPKAKDYVRIGPYVNGGISSLSYFNSDKSFNEGGSLMYGSLGISIISRPIRVPFGKEEDNVFQAGIDIGLTGRKLLGDITQSAQDSIRNQILGFNDLSFGSLECTFFLRFNNVRPYFKITNFSFTDPKMNNIDIKGLSGTRVFFGLEFLSSFFRDDL